MRLPLLATSLALGVACGWGAPPEAPPPPPRETLDGPQLLLGTWRLAPKVLEEVRLNALDEVLGGGPVPTDAQWSDADLAWLAWAGEVHARPPTDPDRVALEKFSKERAERRLVVEASTLSVVGVDGTWTRAWTLEQALTDPTGADLLSIKTSDPARADAPPDKIMVRFEDLDHVEIGPWGKTDQLVRWARLPDPS
jgi:hypothetical protein